ncbi:MULTISPECIES: S8 family peptidase [Leptolyngbya]|uniref:S8 family peptidase n=1 Tax=Leptolyngbya TaxID=47251 RepID=UPI0016885F2B|nr:S8 family peptidase [Leptolyngbya sp. FACHB-1624]MBD1858026.1 S8 family serine peptidase [Leptolyngbya sp. FACHB-1624]
MLFSQANNALDIVSSLFNDSASSQTYRSQLDCGFAPSCFRALSQPEQPDFSAKNTAVSSQGYEDFTSLNSEFFTSQVALASHSFSSIYGYGLVDAASAVAASIGTSRFAPVADQYRSIGLWGLDAVSAPEVWNAGYTGKDIVVAVIDSGVDFTHSDLNDNIWINQKEISGNGIDDDCNGYVDDLIGWDFLGGDNNPMDSDGHGTHVAGTIAAERNGAGIIGVAFDAKIMPIRALDRQAGSDSSIAQGIVYAANNGADVINLSLGGLAPMPETAMAIQYAAERGSMVVIAAGNKQLSEPEYPAYYAKKWGIAVGAIDENWNMAEFSNRAGQDSRLPYIVAPGVNIYSTVPNGNYASENGTSMAAPHVAGVIALMLSANPNLTPTQIRQILTQTTIS